MLDSNGFERPEGIKVGPMNTFEDAKVCSIVLRREAVPEIKEVALITLKWGHEVVPIPCKEKAIGFYPKCRVDFTILLKGAGNEKLIMIQSSVAFPTPGPGQGVQGPHMAKMFTQNMPTPGVIRCWQA